MVAFNTTDKSVSIAQIVIYAILVVPAHFCLFRHGRQGILGWLSVVIFCVIRLVGEVLTLNDDNKGTSSTGALIVENVGLSPLILAAAGILHEAYVTLIGSSDVSRSLTTSENQIVAMSEILSAIPESNGSLSSNTTFL